MVIACISATHEKPVIWLGKFSQFPRPPEIAKFLGIPAVAASQLS